MDDAAVAAISQAIASNEWHPGCPPEYLPALSRDILYALKQARIAVVGPNDRLLSAFNLHREQPWPDGTGSNCRECVGRRFPCPTRQALALLAAAESVDATTETGETL